MGREKTVIAHAAALHLPGKFLLVRQHADHFKHGNGIVAGVGEVARPQAIGLELLIPAVATEGRLAVGPGGLVKSPAAGQKAEDGGADAGTAARQLSFLGMASHQMANLMTQDRRQLGFILKVGQEPPSNEDVAPIHGEGIDRGVVEDREGVALRVLSRGPQHALAHLGHVIRKGAAVHRALLLKLGQRLFPIGARPGAAGEA